MIETKVITPSLTECYSGGGKWLTESKATNFHTFVKRRILLDGETASSWKEVTDAEKTALEAADAQWVEPDAEFIALWNAACMVRDTSYGKYNTKTGYFELNGLTDITTEQAHTIFEAGKISTSGDMYARYLYSKIRTNLPPRAFWSRPIASLICYNCYNIEVFNASSTGIGVSTSSFANCNKLHSFIGGGEITCGQKDNFINCSALENINLKATASMNLPHSSVLSRGSVNHMATSSTSGVTITVHPNVYAKLVGDTENAAVAAMSEEEQAKWVAVMETAASRNVTFAPA